MNTRKWPQEWRDEFDTIRADACLFKDVDDRRRCFLAGLDLARSVGKPWVDVLEHDMFNRAADALLKNYDNEHRQVAYTDHNGRLLNKPLKVGVRSVTADGSETNQRELITALSWAQLQQVRKDRMAQRRSADDTINLIDRLLELFVMAPESTGPQDAADILGISLDQWLTEARADIA